MDSYQDFARIMTERQQFSHLSEELTHYDYEQWVGPRAYSTAAIAGSHKWAAQVIGHYSEIQP